MLPPIVTQLLSFLMGFVIPCFLFLQELALGDSKESHRWLVYFFTIGILISIVFKLIDPFFMFFFPFVYPELKMVFVCLLAFPRFKLLDVLEGFFYTRGKHLLSVMEQRIHETLNPVRNHILSNL